ncbi:LPXTG cell wall anchor domain-containing protein, partial [Enterococcus faecalis]
PVAQKQEVAKKAKGNLPKTGTKMSSVWIILGILILASAIYGMYRKYITK